MQELINITPLAHYFVMNIFVQINNIRLLVDFPNYQFGMSRYEVISWFSMGVDLELLQFIIIPIKDIKIKFFTFCCILFLHQYYYLPPLGTPLLFAG